MNPLDKALADVVSDLGISFAVAVPATTLPARASEALENENRPRVRMIGHVEGYEHSAFGTTIVASDVMHPGMVYRCVVPAKIAVDLEWLNKSPDIEFQGTVRRGDRGPIIAVEHLAPAR